MKGRGTNEPGNVKPLRTLPRGTSTTLPSLARMGGDLPAQQLQERLSSPPPPPVLPQQPASSSFLPASSPLSSAGTVGTVPGGPSLVVRGSSALAGGGPRAPPRSPSPPPSRSPSPSSRVHSQSHAIPRVAQQQRQQRAPSPALQPPRQGKTAAVGVSVGGVTVLPARGLPAVRGHNAVSPRGGHERHAVEQPLPRSQQTVVFLENVEEDATTAGESQRETENGLSDGPVRPQQKQTPAESNGMLEFKEEYALQLFAADVMKFADMDTSGDSRTLNTKDGTGHGEEPPKNDMTLPPNLDPCFLYGCEWEPPLSVNFLGQSPLNVSRRSHNHHNSRNHSVTTLGRSVNMERLRARKRQSIVALNERKKLAKELHISGELMQDDPLVKRMLARETQKRRVKKDAPSLYSVELPTFNEETGTLGDDCVFPKSLTVDDAIQRVLQKERGELRTKTTGVGITRFLTEFQESREIIYLYFWYVVAHVRRVDAENTLIGRFLHLQRVFRGMFPRHKSELPSISSLEQTMAKALGVISKKRQQNPNTDGVSREDELVMFSFVGDDLSVMEGSTCSTPLLSCDGNRSLSRRRSSRRQRLGSISCASFSALGTSELPSDKLQMCDVASVMRCAGAIDVFTVMQVEVYELAEFASRCFHRLSFLFTQAFGRLRAEKDEILAAFMYVVPHVTYYVLLYCFPNDVVAGLFNGPMRLGLYRIFYYWCSGLTATCVRINGWPTPLSSEFSYLSSSSMVMNLAREEGQQPQQQSPLREEDKDDDDNSGEEEEEEEEEEGVNKTSSRETITGGDTVDKDVGTSPDSRSELKLQNTAALTDESVSMAVSPAEDTLRPLNDNAFEEVDVEVANGHHRLIVEFKKYAKHVNYLVRELEQRALDMHRQVLKETDIPQEQQEQQQEQEQLQQQQQQSQSQKKIKKTVAFAEPLNTKDLKEKKKKKGNGNSVVANNINSNNNNYSNIPVNVSPNVPKQSTGRTDDNNVILPRISRQRASSNSSNNSNNTCVLSTFPLDSASASIRQYITRQADMNILRVPLPQLNEATSTEQVQNNAIRTRATRVSLPTASPFFLYFAQERLKQQNSPSTNPMHDSITFFYPDGSRRCSIDSNNNSNTSAVQAAPRHYDTSSNHNKNNNNNTNNTNNNNNGSPRNNVSNSPSSLHNKNNKKGNATTSATLFPHRGAEKTIKLTLIPPSDTRLRPLQFKNFTREVTRRQNALGRQLDMLTEREQQLRRQYNADTQHGLRRVDQLLTECQNTRFDTNTFKNLLGNSNSNTTHNSRGRQRHEPQRQQLGKGNEKGNGSVPRRREARAEERGVW